MLHAGRRPCTRACAGLLAGGTGLTPMLRLIHTILSNPEDRVKVGPAGPRALHPPHSAACRHASWAPDHVNIEALQEGQDLGELRAGRVRRYERACVANSSDQKQQAPLDALAW
jgi:hypothetical protein